MMYPFLTLDDSAENIPCRNERQGMLSLSKNNHAIIAPQ